MIPASNTLNYTVRFLCALALVALTLTTEIQPFWLALGGSAWLGSFLVDRYQTLRERLRAFETWAVAIMVVWLIIDFAVLKQTIFLAITHFLILFQTFKLLGPKTRKDVLQMFLFAFFQILAACTLSVDAWHAIILLSLIPSATTVLFWSQIERECENVNALDAGIKDRYRKMGRWLAVTAIPVNIVFTFCVFVLFPRLTLNAPLPGFGARSSTGYTDQVNLDQKGSLQNNSQTVLWLSIPDAEERRRWDGYVRGDVLDTFNGHQWMPAEEASRRLLVPSNNGLFLIDRPTGRFQAVHYFITLMDSSAATLFVIGRPLQVLAPLPALQQNAGGGLHWMSSWRRPLRYEAVSAFPKPNTPLSTETPPERTLELPTIALTRTRQLAQRIAGKGTDAVRAERLTVYLREHFQYSLDFGTAPNNPVEEFLFESKKGPCGYFASALALMLRTQGIPSRIAAGYLKGEWNNLAQHYVIREKDAHAWVEAYIEGQGWVSYDPTPAQSAVLTVEKGWGYAMRLSWDYVEYKWTKLVIQYDLYAQIRAFENIRGTSDRWGTTLSQWWGKKTGRLRWHWKTLERTSEDIDSPIMPRPRVLLWFILASLAAVAWVYARHQQHKPLRFYVDFLARMEREGFPKQASETGMEFVQRLVKNHALKAAEAQKITEDYYHLRFQNPRTHPDT